MTLVADRLSLAEPAMGAAGAHRGILAAAASGLAGFISATGANPEYIFSRSGIDPETLYHPTASLALVEYCAVMEEAARHSGWDNFGLHYGHQFRPQNLGLIGYIGLHSPTIEAALMNFVADFGWHQHHTHVALVEQGATWRFEYQIRHGGILVRRQDAELTMGMLVNLVRQAAGPDWTPIELHFEHPRPANWRDHSRLFGAQVWFDRPCNAMVIAKDELGRAMPANDPTLLLIMREAIRRLNQPATEQDVIHRARAQINLLLPQGMVELPDVAARMDLSAAGLQRRLREHGLTFSELVDEVRQAMALHLLRQPHLPLSTIGELIGYSELSAFSRAFRRWFGVSPRHWRENTGR